MLAVPLAPAHPSFLPHPFRVQRTGLVFASSRCSGVLPLEEGAAAVRPAVVRFCDVEFSVVASIAMAGGWPCGFVQRLTRQAWRHDRRDSIEKRIQRGIDRTAVIVLLRGACPCPLMVQPSDRETAFSVALAYSRLFGCPLSGFVLCLLPAGTLTLTLGHLL